MSKFVQQIEQMTITLKFCPSGPVPGRSRPSTEDPKVIWEKFQIAPIGLILWANLFSRSSRWQKFWNFVVRAQSRDGPGPVLRIQRSYGRNFKSLLEDWCFEQIFSVIQVHRWLKFETYPQMCHLSQKKLIKLTKNSK